MKPLLVPSSFAPNVGGVEEVVAQVAAEFLRAGHTPTVMTNRWPKDLPARDEVAGIATIRHPFRVLHPSARGVAGFVLHSRRTRGAVVSDARTLGVDVVNLHCVSSNAAYARAAADRLHVPLVVSLHGELGNDAGGAYRPGGRHERTWRRLIERADHITAPSAFVLDEAERFYGRPFADRGSVVPNGVDLELFRRRQVTPDRPYVMALGRLVRPKAFDILIEAWSRVGSDLELRVAGDGPERPALEAAARRTGRNITFTGTLGRADVARHLAAASAFVLPSLAEPLGLVVLEAMAAGAPVVATASGGVPEIVDDGSTGLLVRPGDPDAMARAIREVLWDPDSAAAMAARASQAVQKRTWSASARGLLDAYARSGVSV